ncbi:Cytochrome c family protein (plasmid) [Sinorhizobium sojae CCBAU 05684]|uniref:Cytochrome c family protein n=1 Tax=Sinorhizobium sojae CCBAU 05684 TaxID=716928 RepID=A0A249PKL8_9HYPH|nr:hypothetical protein [Sinorhizobium sojae]ASY66265.1 Cytochrome c family protein [Sinorhizobium sojae CCBAU 05684]
MTNRRFSAGTFAAWILPFLLAAALLLGAPTVEPRTALAQSAEQCADQLIFDPNKGAFLTSDILFLPTQEGANCYAWQMFVAMNWPVNPGWPATPALAGEPDRTASVAEWGVPSSPTSPITSVPVWGSFKAAEDIFLPNAAQPTGWGVQEPPPSECRSDKMIFGYPQESVRVLSAISKNAVNSAHRFNLSSGTRDTVSQEIMEATGGWLTDQDGKLVFFQRAVGKAEFDYIVENNLFDAADQLRVATNQDGQHPKGLSLPRGGMLRAPPSDPQPQEELGAFEIKAAWRILTGEPEMFSRYMTTVAWLKRPDTGQCTQEVVGLVGLHIIHKTDTFPDFIWATFEQVDNVPGGSGSPPVNGYSFNNPDCTGPDCTPNQPRIECDGNTCQDLYPRDQPVQVDRSQKTPNDLVELNSSVQQKIASLTGGKSVFQYYELVNVLWDQSPSSEPTLEPGAGATVPLRYGTFQSEGNLPVANTTLETYIQSRSCDACHASATIAGSETLASDFSFLFEDADSSKAPHLVEQVKRFAGQSK